MNASYLMRQEATNLIGISFPKLERLRAKGVIPEAVHIGRYFVFPVDKIDAIRARLTEQGHIRASAPQVAHAGG